MARLLCLWGLPLAYALSLSSAFAGPANAGHSERIDSPRSVADIRQLLDDVVPKQIERWHAPGAVVVIVKDQALLFSKGYGYADIEAAKPVDPAITLFHVGSVSKPVSATAAMQLVEDGKLDLDRNVDDYFPPPRIPATFPAPLTLRSLLTHTSGLDERLLAAREVRDVREYLHYNLPDRLTSPGITVRYSNHNFVLAGWLIESATGERFVDYMDRHVLAPLEMRHSTFGVPRQAADVSAGYEWRGGRLRRLPDSISPGSPAASLLTSGEDLSHFMIAQLNGGEYHGHQILSRASIERMQRRQFQTHPRAEAPCFGFWEHPRNGVRAVAHTGSTPGFKSNIVLVPDERLGIFASVNGEQGFPALMAIEAAIFDHYFPQQLSATERGTTPPLQELRSIAGTYRGNYYSSRTLAKVILLMEGGHEVRFEPEGDQLAVVAGAQHLTLRRDAANVYYDPAARCSVVFVETGANAYAIAGENVMEKLRPDQTLWFQLGWLSLCLVLMGSFVVGWPATAWARRLWRKGPAAPRPGRAAMWIAGVACASCLSFVAVVALLILGVIQADLMRAVGPVPTWLKLLLWLPVLGAALMPLVALHTILLWRRRIWAVAPRIHYTLVAAALVAAVAWFNNWNLLGWRY